MDDSDARTIYRIPAENLDKFEAECKRLSKKAVKIGCSEIKPFVFGHTTEILSDGLEHRIYEVLFTVEAPKIDGWSFVARLDHANESGNIIRMVPNVNVEMPETYRTSAPSCDHCRQNRRRRDTFVLHCEATGEFKQVGSTCLIDFFGHDPLKMARMAELLGYAHEAGRGYEEFVGGGDLRWYNVERFCQYAAASIRLNGWVSGKAAYEDPSLVATRTIATEWYVRQLFSPSDEDKTLATEALEWAISLRDKDNKTDYEHNILVIAEAGMMELRSAGLAASIVGSYCRHQQKEAEQSARAKASADSQHIGSIGDKLVKVPVTLVGSHIVQNAYTTYIYRFMTDDGNILVWFASNSVSMDIGQKVVLSGTIKAHQEFRGVKNTVVTRCKVV